MNGVPPLLRIGLTGGIAAGKSAIASLWAEAGVGVVDADQLAHAALAPGSPTQAAVVREFGSGIVGADGQIDRQALAALVFGPGNEARRAALNRLVHPVVRQGWRQQLARWASDPDRRLAVADVPLLYETGAEVEFDYVVVVACSAAVQLARLQAKGLALAHAQARLAAQWPLAEKMQRADFVIWNDGSRHLLAAQAQIVLQRIKETDHAPQTL